MWRPDLWLPIGRGRGWGEGVSGYGTYPACPLGSQTFIGRLSAWPWVGANKVGRTRLLLALGLEFLETFLGSYPPKIIGTPHCLPGCLALNNIMQILLGPHHQHLQLHSWLHRKIIPLPQCDLLCNLISGQIGASGQLWWLWWHHLCHVHFCGLHWGCCCTFWECIVLIE